MPLRDHFRAPLDNLRHWESFHACWPTMIVASLRSKLPKGFFAEIQAHSGRSTEIDVATFEDESETTLAVGQGNGGIATAVWAPPRPTLTLVTGLPAQDVYVVLVYDERRRTRLVAAVEIVSPGNKDRTENRRAFVAKCLGLLRERVSVVIVEIVTSRLPNLYGAMLEMMELVDAALKPEPLPLYTAACRMTKRGEEWILEAWNQPLDVGKPLPTMPLWLADDLAVPLELEESYEQSCGVLSIP